MYPVSHSYASQDYSGYSAVPLQPTTYTPYQGQQQQGQQQGQHHNNFRLSSHHHHHHHQPHHHNHNHHHPQQPQHQQFHGVQGGIGVDAYGSGLSTAHITHALQLSTTSHSASGAVTDATFEVHDTHIRSPITVAREDVAGMTAGLQGLLGGRRGPNVKVCESFLSGHCEAGSSCFDAHLLPSVIADVRGAVLAWMSEQEHAFQGQQSSAYQQQHQPRGMAGAHAQAPTFRVFCADLKEVVDVPITALTFTRGLVTDPSVRAKRSTRDAPAHYSQPGRGGRDTDAFSAVASQVPTACGLYAADPASCKWGRWCNQAHISPLYMQQRRTDFAQWATNLEHTFHSLPAAHPFLVHDPMTKRTITVPRDLIVEFTRGLFQGGGSKKAPSLCMLYQRGRCTAGHCCNQIHVVGDAVQSLRNGGDSRGQGRPEQQGAPNAFHDPAAEHPPRQFSVSSSRRPPYSGSGARQRQPFNDERPGTPSGQAAGPPGQGPESPMQRPASGGGVVPAVSSSRPPSSLRRNNPYEPLHGIAPDGSVVPLHELSGSHSPTSPLSPSVAAGRPPSGRMAMPHAHDPAADVALPAPLDEHRATGPAQAHRQGQGQHQPGSGVHNNDSFSNFSLQSPMSPADGAQLPRHNSHGFRSPLGSGYPAQQPTALQSHPPSGHQQRPPRSGGAPRSDFVFTRSPLMEASNDYDQGYNPARMASLGTPLAVPSRHPLYSGSSVAHNGNGSPTFGQHTRLNPQQDEEIAPPRPTSSGHRQQRPPSSSNVVIRTRAPRASPMTAGGARADSGSGIRPYSGAARDAAHHRPQDAEPHADDAEPMPVFTSFDYGNVPSYAAGFGGGDANY